jgi:cytosine deaminase
MEALPAPPFVLCDATVPLCVLGCAALRDRLAPRADADGCVRLNISVAASGRVASLTLTSDDAACADDDDASAPRIALRGRMVLPCFIDLHTHVDKGHTWARSPNANGSRDGAFAAALADAELYTPDDLTRRVDFSLACAYAYGTSAVRTHVTTTPAHAAWVWPLMAAARDRWAGRVELQLVGMVAPLSAFAPGGAGLALTALVAARRGILGASLSQLTCAPGDNVTSLAREALTLQAGAHGGARGRDFPALLDALFSAAVAHDLDIDVHADENGDDAADALLLTARAATAHGWGGRVTVGHACALALLDPTSRDAALAAAAAANLAVVSLPLANMYLQDRVPGRTPRWRGITTLHELAATPGIRVCVASDNTRDAFHAFGDLDMLDTFRAAVRAGHLDHPFGDWLATVTRTPADVMGLSATHGRIAEGMLADVIVFRARSYGELLSRSQHDRVVLRRGVALAAEGALPEYETLDDLMIGTKNA